MLLDYKTYYYYDIKSYIILLTNVFDRLNAISISINLIQERTILKLQAIKITQWIWTPVTKLNDLSSFNFWSPHCRRMGLTLFLKVFL